MYRPPHTYLRIQTVMCGVFWHCFVVKYGQSLASLKEITLVKCGMLPDKFHHVALHPHARRAPIPATHNLKRGF